MNTRCRNNLLILALLFGPPFCLGQQWVGNVISTTTGPDQADFVLEQGWVARVQLLSDDTIRVRLNSSGSLLESTSGAVLEPSSLVAPGSIVWDTLDTTYFIATDFYVLVLKHPFRVVVLRPDGAILHADIDRPYGYFPENGLMFGLHYAMPGQRFMGLGLRGGPIDRRGSSVAMNNTDQGLYGETTTPLYSSTPFYYSSVGSRYHGLFLDSPAQSFFDMDTSGHGLVVVGAYQRELDYYLFAGPQPPDVAQAFARLSGPAYMPPLWSLGYQQSRFGYASWGEIQAVADGLRSHAIPADAIHLDLFYQDGLKIFTWDPAQFADPQTNNQSLAAKGFRSVNIVDPWLLTGDPLYSEVEENGYFVKNPDGSPTVSNIFAGPVSWLDFTNPGAAQWYKERLSTFLQSGVSAVWNDLNEPGAPLSNSVYDFDGNPRPDVEARNIYALTETELSRQAMLDLRPNERPFILSRSGYPGIQRTAANWSGDAGTSFESLRVNIQMTNHMALSGQQYFGHDVGGFLGTPSAELYTRWLQFASYTPFLRTHSLFTSAPREPWVYGEPYTSIIRSAINTRYQQLPYWYSLAERASRTGEPIVAPLFYHFPNDQLAFNSDTSFLAGPSLLVAPVHEGGAVTRDVYLPVGAGWYDTNSLVRYEGGQTVTVSAPIETTPVFARDPSIIPGGPLKQFVDEAVPPLVTLDIIASEEASFELYEDDGISYDYQTVDAFLRTRIEFNTYPTANELVVAQIDGSWSPPQRTWLLRFHMRPTPPTDIFENSEALTRFDSPLEFSRAPTGWMHDSERGLVIVRLQGDPTSRRIFLAWPNSSL